MKQLEHFLTMLCGHFDNALQLQRFNEEGVTGYPKAEHINTICNDKITDLPEDFSGSFVLEESYYNTNGTVNPMPHLFLITKSDEGICLSSYDMPEGYTKETFTYENLTSIPLSELKRNEKFTPIVYKEENGGFYGKSISMFSPVLKFTLEETFYDDVLFVSETFEVNGKRTFGYDQPLEYRRCM